MDQMASALGQPHALLALRCQPAELEPPLALPPEIAFYGVDSGVRHSVGGADYGTVRAAAFMGLRIISQLAQEVGKGTAQSAADGARHAAASSCNAGSASGQPASEAAPAQPPPAAFRGYLANLPPSRFSSDFERHLPEWLAGAEFALQYGSHHYDAVTTVQGDRSYPVRVSTGHPVHESFRVAAFRELLEAGASGAVQKALLGELMLQSHASYGACGLGSAGTDRCAAACLVAS